MDEQLKRYQFIGKETDRNDLSFWRETPDGKWMLAEDVQAAIGELRAALRAMTDYFGVGSNGCNCHSKDCPIRNGVAALAKYAPGRGKEHQ